MAVLDSPKSTPHEHILLMPFKCNESCFRRPCRWLQQPFAHRTMAVSTWAAPMAMHMTITTTCVACLKEPTMVALMAATMGIHGKLEWELQWEPQWSPNQRPDGKPQSAGPPCPPSKDLCRLPQCPACFRLSHSGQQHMHQRQGCAGGLGTRSGPTSGCLMAQHCL